MVKILLEVPCLCDIFQVKAETYQFLDGLNVLGIVQMQINQGNLFCFFTHHLHDCDN